MSHEPVQEVLSLRPGVYTAARAGTRYLLTNQGGRVAGADDAQVGRLLEQLAGGGATAAQLSAGDPRLAELLASWRAGGWLSITVRCGDRDLYTMVPYRRPAPPPISVPDNWELSRFAVIRNDGGPVVESPRAWCNLRILDPAMLATIVAGSPAEDLASAAALRLAQDLTWCGLAVPTDAEQRALGTRQWYPHELWFHHRTRINERLTLEEGFAGTYWLKGEFDPPPPPPAANGPTVALHQPDLAQLRATDPSFTAVSEQRRSVRLFNDEQPITAAQVGELLYRCARRSGAPLQYGVEQERRPYPAGGGMHDLVLYPVVRRVDGLAPGMYRYDAEQHVLSLVCEPNRATHRLIEAAGGAAVLPRADDQSPHPQLLLIISARFERTMWKYQQIGYAMMLKTVGALYQQLYLAATAMGLAPCALGTGDSAAFSEATGHDPLTESSVGELIVGTPARTPAEVPTGQGSGQ